MSYAQLLQPVTLFGSAISAQTPPREPLPELVYELEFTSYGIQFLRACQGLLPQESTEPAVEEQT